jgi:hypothetical protein
MLLEVAPDILCYSPHPNSPLRHGNRKEK